MNSEINIGVWGERRAERYLKENNFKVIETNFRSKAGEIDIVAIEEKTILFIEVKTRADLSCGLPCEAVDRKKRYRIIRAALLYIAMEVNKRLLSEVSEFRFDVIEILVLNSRVWLRHIKNAFSNDDW